MASTRARAGIRLTRRTSPDFPVRAFSFVRPLLDRGRVIREHAASVRVCPIPRAQVARCSSRTGSSRSRGETTLLMILRRSLRRRALGLGIAAAFGLGATPLLAQTAPAPAPAPLAPAAPGATP